MLLTVLLRMQGKSLLPPIVGIYYCIILYRLNAIFAVIMNGKLKFVGILMAVVLLAMMA